MELQQQIQQLQHMLAERASPPNSLILADKDLRTTQVMSSWRQPIARALESRVSRQGVKNNISDKTRKTDTSQSKSSNPEFLRPRDVSPSEKDCFSETHTKMNQSSSSGQSVFSGPTDTDLPEARDRKRQQNKDFWQKAKMMRMMIQQSAGLLKQE
jgi:hypothetical protein